MKIMISAGEASGDMHAGALVKEIKKIDSKAEVFGMGGDCLRNAGGEVLFDIKEHGVMGIFEVIKKLPQLFKLRDDMARVMDERRPDVLVVIDYPEFNMRLAKVAKSKGIPIVSFIAPSAWVWRKGRAKGISELVDKITSIFPMEYDCYKEAGADIEFVGHPLMDIVKPTKTKEETRAKLGIDEMSKIVLLLPGSRLQEIKNMLPQMLKTAKIMKAKDPSLEFIMPRANTIPKEMLTSALKEYDTNYVRITEEETYDLMNISDVAVATSGTVTLEAAILELPCVICYKTSALTAFIARSVIGIKTIGLPNIVAGRIVMPELLQETMTPENMAKEAFNLIKGPGAIQAKLDLKEVHRKLGEEGALKKVAEITFKVANEKSPNLKLLK